MPAPLSLILSVITAPFKAGLGAASGMLHLFGAAAREVFTSLKGWFSSLMVAVVGIIGAITTTLGTFTYMAAQLQHQMAFVMTMVKDTEKWTGKLTEGVKTASIAYGQSFAGLTKALYDILSATVPVEDSLHVLDTTAKAAIAGFVDVTMVGRTLTSVMNAMGISFDQAGKVSDVMFRIVEKGQLTFAELQGHMGRAMVAARSSKIPFEELGAAYAFLTRNGFSVAMAETAIAGALERLVVPLEDGKVLAKELGLELGETAVASKGLLGMMKHLAEKKLSMEEFERIIPERRARRAVLAMTMGLKAFSKDVDAMYTSANATNRAFNKAAETLVFQWNRLLQTFKVLFVEIVEPLLPVLTQLFKRIQAIGEYLRESFKGDKYKSAITNIAASIRSVLERLFFWLLQWIPYIFDLVGGYLELIYKRIDLFPEAFRLLANIVWEIVKQLGESIHTLVDETYDYIIGIINSFLGGFGSIVEKIIKWLFPPVQGGFEKTKNSFTKMTDLINSGLGSTVISFEAMWKKILEWHEKYTEKLEEKYASRVKRIKEMQEKLNADELKGTEKLAEGKTDIEHEFEDEEIVSAKKTNAELMQEVEDRVKFLKAMGELSLKAELKVYKELLKALDKFSSEASQVIEKIYAIEKEMRDLRKQEAFKFLDEEEITERRRLTAKMKIIKELVKSDKLSYDERLAAFKEFQDLKQKLNEAEKEEYKKLNDFYQTEFWKRINAQKDLLKKVRFEHDKDAERRKQLLKAEHALDRMFFEQRWKFIHKLRVKDGKEWDLEGLRKLKVAERHAEESLRADKISFAEAKKIMKELEKIRGEISEAEKQVKKRDKISDKDLLEKEKEWKKRIEKEIAEWTGEKIDEVAAKEEAASEKRLGQAEAVKDEIEKIAESANEKVEQISETFSNTMVASVDLVLKKLKELEQELVEILATVQKACAAIKECSPILGFGLGRSLDKLVGYRGVLGPPTGPLGMGRIENIYIGPIHVGEVNSEVDLKRLADKIGEEFTSSTTRDFRIIG